MSLQVLAQEHPAHRELGSELAKAPPQIWPESGADPEFRLRFSRDLGFGFGA